MRIRTSLIATGGLVCGLLAAASAAQGEPTTTVPEGHISIAAPATTEPIGEDFSEDRRFRTTFGLDQSTETIESAHDLLDQGSPLVSMEYAVPVFTDEYEELGLRRTVSRATADALPVIFHDLPGVLAGSYTDNANSGEFVITLTQLDSSIQETVMSQVPYPDRTQLRLVDYRLEDLDQLVDAIALDNEIFEGTNIQFIEGGSDFRTDRAVVVVDGDLALARALLAQRYPIEQLTVTAAHGLGGDEGTMHPVAPPWAGAQSIVNISWSNSLCNTAFTAYEGAGATLKSYILTAGHCGLEHDVVDQGSLEYGLAGLSPVARESEYLGLADAMSLQTSNANSSDDIVLEPGTLRDIASYQRRDDDQLGDVVCMSKITYVHPSCGELLGVSYDQDGESFGREASFLYLRRASYTSAPTDSGSSVYWRHQALGIHKGKTDDGESTLYSHIDLSLQVLGLDGLRITD